MKYHRRCTEYMLCKSCRVPGL